MFRSNFVIFFHILFLAGSSECVLAGGPKLILPPPPVVLSPATACWIELIGAERIHQSTVDFLSDLSISLFSNREFGKAATFTLETMRSIQQKQISVVLIRKQDKPFEINVRSDGEIADLTLSFYAAESIVKTSLAADAKSAILGTNAMFDQQLKTAWLSEAAHAYYLLSRARSETDNYSLWVVVQTAKQWQCLFTGNSPEAVSETEIAKQLWPELLNSHRTGDLKTIAENFAWTHLAQLKANSTQLELSLTAKEHSDFLTRGTLLLPIDSNQDNLQKAFLDFGERAANLLLAQKQPALIEKAKIQYRNAFRELALRVSPEDLLELVR